MSRICLIALNFLTFVLKGYRQILMKITIRTIIFSATRINKIFFEIVMNTASIVELLKITTIYSK